MNEEQQNWSTPQRAAAARQALAKATTTETTELARGLANACASALRTQADQRADPGVRAFALLLGAKVRARDEPMFTIRTAGEFTAVMDRCEARAKANGKSKRFAEAMDMVNHGASNPSGCAYSIMRMCEEALAEGDNPRTDPAVRLAMTQIVFLTDVGRADEATLRDDLEHGLDELGIEPQPQLNQGNAGAIGNARI